MKYLKRFDTAADYAAFLTSGEMVKPNVSYIAEDGGVHYHRATRILIQHIDGNLYTTAEWTAEGFTNDVANGVAVVADEAQFVIGVQGDVLQWGPDGIVEGVLLTTDANVAAGDYDGKKNSELILAAGNASGVVSTCDKLTFKNGQGGYLPALGELILILNHKEEINAVGALIGRAAIGGTYWSSTLYSETEVWIIGNTPTSAVNYPRSDSYPNVLQLGELILP